jgi:hypothetical protein
MMYILLSGVFLQDDDIRKYSPGERKNIVGSSYPGHLIAEDV